MTADQTSPTTARVFTDADLDTVKALCDAATELWPTYATSMLNGFTEDGAREYSIVGIDGDGEAVFQSTDYDGRTSEQFMPLRYVLDNTALIADVKAKREAEARTERERQARITEERRARQEWEEAQARARREAEDLAAYQRVQSRIAAGEITADGRPVIDPSS